MFSFEVVLAPLFSRFQPFRDLSTSPVKHCE